MRENISVREWQDRFRAGDFDSKDTTTQCEAGWYDWFCQDHALAGRLKKIGKVVMGITDPFILDNYYVWFKNNCPLDGPLYDDVRFEPLVGERDGKYFLVALDSPHQRMKWALTTERFGFGTPEFECKNVREVIQYINELGPQLEQGITPPFIAEKFAVDVYTRIYGEPLGIHVYREGEHRYSYTSHLDKRRHIVMASADPSDLKGMAPGSSAKQTEEIKGIHVYCPDFAGKAPTVQWPASNKSQKRRERAMSRGPARRTMANCMSASGNTTASLFAQRRKWSRHKGPPAPAPRSESLILSIALRSRTNIWGS